MKHRVLLLAIAGIALSASLSAVNIFLMPLPAGLLLIGAVDRDCHAGGLRLV